MRHRFHALCPYFAMFPEAFAEHWIEVLTRRGEAVLDPFCGRGTTPFQALLMGRRAVACDINPVAYCVTRAKTNAPSAQKLMRRIGDLERRYRAEDDRTREEMPEFFSYAYHPETLAELLFLRERLRWRATDTDCMLAALILGSLHGEAKETAPYLSNQMPRTISTKPDYSIRYWQRHGMAAPRKDVFALLRDRVDYRYASEPPEDTAHVMCADMRELPRRGMVAHGSIRTVITSPPYLDVTNFEEDQWLRLWFLGHAPHPTRGVISHDDRHYGIEQYWALIADTWRTLGALLGKKSNVVMRVGMKGVAPERIAEGLLGCSVVTGRKVKLVSTETSEIRRRQTDAFRPGSKGCLLELDAHFAIA
ncbi:MAG TPA: DNA methyltransferase [Solirubrobacteraceae bacterium]|nr:DNA methyltransferase [Solirubrobacteraceae bacterium]